MRILVLISVVLFAVIPGAAQNQSCFRIMPVSELARQSTFIARVKVARTQRANYKGMFSQLAQLNPVDVLNGDFTIKEINVLADSNVPCAEDSYTGGQEMLVFLVPEDSLYRTLNFQYGEFKMDGEVVKGWRDKDNNPTDRPYADVKKEIIAFLNPAVTPPKPTEGPREGPPTDEQPRQQMQQNPQDKAPATAVTQTAPPKTGVKKAGKKKGINPPADSTAKPPISP